MTQTASKETSPPLPDSLAMSASTTVSASTATSDALHRYFGFSEFRPLQREIVEALLAKQDVFALMPTGAGKSLCYQLPAAMMPGIAIVVSPLIALMKDQVDALNATGIPATFLNSSLSPDELSDRVRRIKLGEYKLLYVAPERFPSAGFIPFLQSLEQSIGLSLITVDEAHCISEWGHDFRADYRTLHILRDRFPNVPIAALTATATDRVQQDIIAQLHLRSSTRVFKASFDRPNLRYEVLPKRGQLQQLIGYLESRKGESGIIYALSRASTEDLAGSLKAQGFKAIAYHAGLERQQRAKAQEAFARDKVDIVCATIAFGMGIDKSNVRFVIHYDLPKNIPSYYQETGRAGRDGLPSDCITFYRPGDDKKLIRFFDEKAPEERERAIQELGLMVDLLETRTCRRKLLLGYFGEEYKGASGIGGASGNCGGCDNCLSNQAVTHFDATRLAQMFLSCVVRVKEDFSAAHIINILRGSNRQRLLDFRHHLLPTFGVGKAYDRDEWKHFANEFKRLGLFREDLNRFNIVKLTKAGIEVLRGTRTIEIPNAKESRLESSEPAERSVYQKGRSSAPTARLDLPDLNSKLFEELRTFRRQLAEERDVPPFIIASDAVLLALSTQLPADGNELRKVSGIGEAKAADFGLPLLTVIRKFVVAHPAIATKKLEHKPKEKTIKDIEGGDSAFATLSLFRKGLPPKTIAEQRGLAPNTIATHLLNFVETGDIDAIEALVERKKIEPIRKAFEKCGNLLLAPAKQSLGDDYSYDELRYVRAFDARTRRNK